MRDLDDHLDNTGGVFNEFFTHTFTKTHPHSYSSKTQIIKHTFTNANLSCSGKSNRLQIRKIFLIISSAAYPIFHKRNKIYKNIKIKNFSTIR